MNTLRKSQASGSTTEARVQPEETVSRIEKVLRHLDVVPSKVEQHSVSYAPLYLLGLFFLLTSLVVADRRVDGAFSGISKSDHYFITFMIAWGSRLVNVVAASLIIWTFNIWRWHVPHTLRDVFEKRRIDVSAGDINTHYLGFLEHYRDALIPICIQAWNIEAGKTRLNVPGLNANWYQKSKTVSPDCWSDGNHSN